MKTETLIRPSWWYLLASLPLATTSVISYRYLEAASLNYRMAGGLRPIFVLGTVQFASLLGILAVIALGIFIGSAFTMKFHDSKILKLFSLTSLFLYGFWSILISAWILIK